MSPLILDLSFGLIESTDKVTFYFMPEPSDHRNLMASMVRVLLLL